MKFLIIASFILIGLSDGAMRLDPAKLLAHLNQLTKQDRENRIRITAFQHNLTHEVRNVGVLIHNINYGLANNESIDSLVHNLTEHYSTLQELLLPVGSRDPTPNTTQLLLAHATVLSDTTAQVTLHLNEINAHVWSQDSSARFAVRKLKVNANETDTVGIHERLALDGIAMLEHYVHQQDDFLNDTNTLNRTELRLEATNLTSRAKVVRQSFNKQLAEKVNSEVKAAKKLAMELADEMKHHNKTTEATEKEFRKHLDNVKRLIGVVPGNHSSSEEWDLEANQEIDLEEAMQELDPESTYQEWLDGESSQPSVDPWIALATKWDIASATVLSYGYHLEGLMQDARLKAEAVLTELDRDTDKELVYVYQVLLTRDLESLKVILPRLETMINRHL